MSAANDAGTGTVTAAVFILIAIILALLIASYRLGADNEFEAGRAVGRMEAQPCGEDTP